MTVATKQSGKPVKASAKRAKRIPNVKRLEARRPLIKSLANWCPTE